VKTLEELKEDLVVKTQQLNEMISQRERVIGAIWILEEQEKESKPVEEKQDAPKLKAVNK
jgi:inorganic pyrophosphatase